MPNKYRCSTGSIFVISIVPDTFKELKSLVLSKIVDELNELSDNGIKINDKILHIFMQYICADNLSAHSILGMQESFSAEFCCRYCVGSKEDFQKIFLDSEYKPRDNVTYEDAVKKLMVNSVDPVEGLKSISELNELKYLSLNQMCPPDIFHDFLEGNNN